jgi:hypothetical protein
MREEFVGVIVRLVDHGVVLINANRSNILISTVFVLGPCYD